MKINKIKFPQPTFDMLACIVNSVGYRIGREVEIRLLEFDNSLSTSFNTNSKLLCDVIFKDENYNIAKNGVTKFELLSTEHFLNKTFVITVTPELYALLELESVIGENRDHPVLTGRYGQKSVVNNIDCNGPSPSLIDDFDGDVINIIFPTFEYHDTDIAYRYWMNDITSISKYEKSKLLKDFKTELKKKFEENTRLEKEKKKWRYEAYGKQPKGKRALPF